MQATRVPDSAGESSHAVLHMNTTVTIGQGASSLAGPPLIMAAGILILGTGLIDSTRLPLLAVPAAFLVAAYGVGSLLARKVGSLVPGVAASIHGEPAMLTLSLRITLGVAGLSLLGVLCALLGHFRVAGLALLIGVGVGLWQMVWNFRSLAASPLRFSEAAGGVLMGIVWLVTWLWGTIPPTFFDELAYHLVIPQRILATGSLYTASWNFFTLMPHASDVLLAWGMAVAGELGGRAIHVALWIACSLAAWGLAEAVAGSKSNTLAGTLTVAALAASPTLWFVGTLPFSEAGLALSVVSALGLVARSDAAARPWVPLGLLLGMAATMKLTGVYWAAAGLAGAWAAGWSRRELGRAALLVLASLAPWWGRSLIQTGNPIYPMGYEILGGAFWSEDSRARVLGDVAPNLADLGPTGVLHLPYDLWRHHEYFGSGADAGLLALVVTGAVLLGPVFTRLFRLDARQRGLADSLAVFVLVAGIGWLLTSTTTRFFAPALVVTLSVTAGSLLWLKRSGQAVGLALLLVAGGIGTWHYFSQHHAAFSSFNVALGLEDKESYLRRQLEHYAAARYVQETLPAEAKLLFIGETRAYYFRREAVAPSAYDHHPLKDWVEEAASSEKLALLLAEEGFTHVVLNVREFKRLNAAYGLLAFTGPTADAKAQRLKQVPNLMATLFSENGVYVLEVPSAVIDGSSVGREAERGQVGLAGPVRSK